MTAPDDVTTSDYGVGAMTDEAVVDHARGLGLRDFEYPEAVAVACAHEALRRGLISASERDWLVSTKPTAATSWPAGSHVRVTVGAAFKGLDGTVVGPATQAGMDVVVHLDGLWPAEFRNWELEALDAR